MCIPPIHDFLGQSEPTTQTTSLLVQPFLQGSLVWQTDRPTDHTTRSLKIGNICVRNTAMRPNNNNDIPCRNSRVYSVAKNCWTMFSDSQYRTLLLLKLMMTMSYNYLWYASEKFCFFQFLGAWSPAWLFIRVGCRSFVVSWFPSICVYDYSTLGN